jgi:hypothetical protein
MNLLEKEFVPYEQALALKELGFDEPCFGSWETEYAKVPTYTHSCSQFYKNSNHPKGKVTAPTFSQAFRFFREEWGLYPHIFSEPNQHFVWCIRWYVDKLQKDIPYESSPTYEEAELACLRKLIEIVKQNQ